MPRLFISSSTLRRQRVSHILAAALIASLLSIGQSVAHAHRSSDAFLSLARTAAPSDGAQTLSLRWDIALRDLDARLDLDTDRDGRLTWGEVRTRQPDIDQLAGESLRIERGGLACVPGPIHHALDQHSDGTYAVLTRQLTCPPVAAGAVVPGTGSDDLMLDYRLFGGFDPGHRAILTSGSFSRVLSADDGPIRVPLLNLASATEADGDATVGATRATSLDNAAPSGVAANPSGDTAGAFASYVTTGMHHILVGWDHLAFLALLILPSVLSRQDRRWVAASNWRDSLRSLLLTVTAFTVAHSITLSLSALGLLVPPASLIEPLIALSIVAAATLNIWPTLSLTRRAWPLAFGFGLIHGFGFASALSDAGLSGTSLAIGLLGFNLGVEIGQVLFIALLWSPLWLMRRWQSLGQRAMPALSLLLGLLGAAWFIQRVFDLTILPG